MMVLQYAMFHSHVFLILQVVSYKFDRMKVEIEYTTDSDEEQSDEPFSRHEVIRNITTNNSNIP